MKFNMAPYLDMYLDTQQGQQRSK